MALANNQALAYEYQRSQAQTASPLRLVLMLYDGAIRFLAVARDRMGARDIEGQHTHLVKAQRILAELLSSLDREHGGEVAANLHRLYLFMLQRLVQANLEDRQDLVDEVIRMLRELRESWAVVEASLRAAGGHAPGAEDG